jgi:hypothetical protein
LPYSSGVVEGNRVKMIKRQMYGRAGFRLLRKRILYPNRHEARPTLSLKLDNMKRTTLAKE